MSVKLSLLVGSLVLLSCALPLNAQDHGEVGVFADYFRVQAVPLDLVGVGGRASVNIRPHAALEAELAYDFDRAFGTTFNSGASLTAQRTSMRALHGMFGPKFQIGTGALRAFVTVKGGVVDFRFSNLNPTSGFESSIDNLRADSVNGVLYPGGGGEAYLGPIGLRLDVGDQIYFNHGANHNLAITFGPHIRF